MSGGVPPLAVVTTSIDCPFCTEPGLIERLAVSGALNGLTARLGSATEGAFIVPCASCPERAPTAPNANATNNKTAAVAAGRFLVHSRI